MKVRTDFKQKTDGQPTLEWMLARTGVVTASDASNLVTPLGKIKSGDAVETYLIEKLAERWIGGPIPSNFSNFNCEQGSILEEQAIPYASVAYDLAITTVGFVELSDDVGCSPDGVIFHPADGLKRIKSGIEIKCPTLEKHLGYLLAGEVPKDYIAQVQFSMWVCGCPTWHFLSYRRGFPALHLTVERDDKFQDAFSEAVPAFLERLRKATERLMELNGGPPNPKTRGAVPFTVPEKREVLDNIP